MENFQSLAVDAVVIGGSIIGGIWVLVKTILNSREEIDHRISKLEKVAVTRVEFNASMRELREEQRAAQIRLDNKLEAMNGNIMLLVHTLTSKEKS